jgi:hypothetical protein
MLQAIGAGTFAYRARVEFGKLGISSRRQLPAVIGEPLGAAARRGVTFEMRGSIVTDPRTLSSGRVRRRRPPDAPAGRTGDRDAVWRVGSASGAR